MIILGQLPWSKKGNTLVTLISDCSSKLKRSTNVSKKTAKNIAPLFFNHLIVLYGNHDCLQTDRRNHSLNKIFATVCVYLRVKHMMTIEHYPETKGQIEKYIETIAACLQNYAKELQDSWDMFVQPLKFAYSTQGHGSSGVVVFCRGGTSSTCSGSTRFLVADSIEPIRQFITPHIVWSPAGKNGTHERSSWQ